MLRLTRGDALNDDTYDLGGEEQAEGPKRPGLPVEPRRLLRILLERKKLLGLTFVVATVLSGVAFFFLPKTFEAETVLLYEGAPVLDEEGTPPTQDAFVRSAAVPSRLIEVRERLGWELPLEELEDALSAKAITETSMRIAGQAAKAEDAYMLVRTALDVFMAQQQAFNGKELERLIASNDRSIASARERRDEAQKSLESFRETSGRRDLIQERAQLLERAAELRTSRDEAQVEIAAQQALIAELEEAQAELPKQVVASAKKSNVVEGPLAQARAELAQARATLSNRHPRVLALKERVAQLEAQRGRGRSELSEQTVAINPARAGVDRELASARAALAAAEERSNALNVLLVDAERELAALTPEEGEARRVFSDLVAANERLEQLTERQAELRDAALTPVNRFRILSPPVLPEEATRSGAQVKLLFLMPFVAVFFAAFIVLFIALRSLRVMAPREVAWWGNGPVLGTTIWPRDPAALQGFVDEMEDQGVHAAGRTLVVPASEVEREDACAFAMKLAEAPWLAAAILDVGDRVDSTTVVAPTPRVSEQPILTPSAAPRMRRLSADASPAVPSPPRASVTRKPNRPPRKRTVVGLPAVSQPDGSTAPPAPQTPPPSSMPSGPASPAPPSSTSSGPQPFRRKRGARATVRMIIPAASGVAGTRPDGANTEEEAFLLTRPVPTRSDAREEARVGPAVLVTDETPRASTSNAVMRAAVRLLGEGDEDLTEIRRSSPPSAASGAEVQGVALAWNGPLSGPVLRRAARLAHRVIVVVSSGSTVVDLGRVRARLGRSDGIGYVLINVDDAFADVEDRVGAVDEFWQGSRASDS
jgi:uncharacterized protein involved in exopolysaccharide biosynthesis